MAKIRVFELARDMNMTSKMLLDKMEELDISANNHMSALEDSDVEQIKSVVLGTKSPDDRLVETRVKPTVIRRRRKAVEEAERADTRGEASEVAVLEDEASVPEKTVETASSEGQMNAESEAFVEEIVTPEETVLVEEQGEQEPPTEVSAADQADEGEDVVAAAEASEPEVIEEAKTPADREVEPEIEKNAAPSEEPETEPTPPTETSEAAMEATDVADASQPSAPTEKTPSEKPPTKAKTGKKQVKTIKRPKTDTPAKIIKMPEPEAVPVEAKQSPARPSQEKAPAEPTAREAPAKEVKRKKKRRKEIEEESPDKKFFKKKISFRKKEVVEGDALYAGGPKRGKKGKKGDRGKPLKGQKPQITTPKAIKRRIKVDEAIVLSDLAKRMGIKAGDMIKTLMGLGVMTTVNQTIDFETAALVAAEFDYELEKASFEEDAFIRAEQDEPGNLKFRPPVVTIMGHVDHGKTSLLDVIRKTRVTENEAGGITQHIGAYNVKTEKGNVVFLDTPGHEAFTAMRARGAQVTDIVVLVVAADDGVMPQTIEAINHSKAAEVPMIVAINKIDKANADPDRVLRELADQGLSPEEWGGDTIFVKVSAKRNQGIDELLEMILLQAEMLELKANPDKLARGWVIEAKLDTGRGPVATVLVQEGTLKSGDPVVCGVHYGRTRALLDDRGAQVESASPSMPVEILGLSGVPQAGDELIALKDEKDAKQISNNRLQKQRSKDLAKTNRLSLESLYEQIRDGEVKDLNIILKADVHGSIEALRESLTKLSNEEVKINVIHSATGSINESDINLAAVSNAIIIGFNVRPAAKFQSMAAEENVDMQFYNVIYDVIKDVKDAIVGMMSSQYVEHVQGHAEVRQLFHVPRVGTIAGCYVTDGKVERGGAIRVLRDGVVMYDGKVSSLKRYKEDAKEVQSGYECGISVENFNDIKLGDVLESYYMEEIRPEL